MTAAQASQLPLKKLFQIQEQDAKEIAARVKRMRAVRVIIERMSLEPERCKQCLKGKKPDDKLASCFEKTSKDKCPVGPIPVLIPVQENDFDWTGYDL
jgi:hypothetical protein